MRSIEEIQHRLEELENYQVAHFRMLSDSNFIPYGKSIIEGGRRVWKQLSLMEDAMLIHRVMRAPEKRIFKVDVGNIPPSEVDHPIVSADVPAYGLRGKAVSDNPRIEEHWNTAGMLLVNSPAFYDLPWYHNAYLNLSDDPTFQSMAERLHRRVGAEVFEDTYGMTWVRKDIRAEHRGQLLPVENRRIPPRDI